MLIPTAFVTRIGICATIVAPAGTDMPKVKSLLAPAPTVISPWDFEIKFNLFCFAAIA